MFLLKHRNFYKSNVELLFLRNDVALSYLQQQQIICFPPKRLSPNKTTQCLLFNFCKSKSKSQRLRRIKLHVARTVTTYTINSFLYLRNTGIINPCTKCRKEKDRAKTPTKQCNECLRICKE